ncbi:DUF2142 domain-containing protein [Cellulosimicrobium sp. PMB13]|uniref:DUF2142 domain-containing protein n=1 Tax=Cellulosimicrobium sp. PMB13 TaxID=3120158 RepID=UPI003F4C3A51
MSVEQEATDLPETAAPSTVRSRRAAGAAAAPLVGLLLFVVFLTSWALASPVGSSPDEDYHLASIWCAQGDRDGACVVDGDGEGADATYAVPADVRNAPCFAFDPAESAACQRADETGMVETERGNFGAHAGDYPPVFYATMSLFVGPDLERSVLVMRLVNVLIAAAMLAATYVASSVRVRRGVVATVGVTLVPLGAFIVPSINPSSWAVTSALTLFFGVLGFLTAKDRWRAVALALVSVVSLVLAAGSRADASVYSIVGIGAAVVTALSVTGLTRRALVRLPLPVALAAVAAWSYGAAGQAVGGGETVRASVGDFVLVAWDALGYWVGALGMSPLGWLDTSLPAVVWVLVTACFFAVVFVALADVGVWRGAMVAGVALAAVLVPTYIEATSASPAGSVQARYLYPLLILLAAVATTSTERERRDFRLTTVQRWVVVLAVSTAGAVALYTNVRRYVTGDDVIHLRLTPAEWWWEGLPVSPDLVVLAGSAALLVALATASRVLVMTRTDTPHREPDADSGAGRTTAESSSVAA